MESVIAKYFGFFLMAVSLAGLFILFRRFGVKYGSGRRRSSSHSERTASEILRAGTHRLPESARRIPADGRRLSGSDSEFLSELSKKQTAALKRKRS